jgi:hypothetical protein
MDIGGHHCTQGRKHQAVTLERLEAPEPFSNDAHAEVPFAFTCAGMAGMQMAFVDDLELYRAERVFEQCANLIDAGGVFRRRSVV